MPEEGKDFKHIVRVVNTDLDGNKPICQALRKIKGIGAMFANMVCNLTGVERTKKTGFLTDEEINKLDDFMNFRLPDLIVFFILFSIYSKLL